MYCEKTLISPGLCRLCATSSVIQTNIRSYRHKLFVNQQNKVGLSAIDDKRFLCEDGIATRAHGHWRNDFEF